MLESGGASTLEENASAFYVNPIIPQCLKFILIIGIYAGMCVCTSFPCSLSPQVNEWLCYWPRSGDGREQQLGARPTMARFLPLEPEAKHTRRAQ